MRERDDGVCKSFSKKFIKKKFGDRERDDDGVSFSKKFGLYDRKMDHLLFIFKFRVVEFFDDYFS